MSKNYKGPALERMLIYRGEYLEVSCDAVLSSEKLASPITTVFRGHKGDQPGSPVYFS